MHTKGHVLFLYKDKPLRINLLADYLKDGFNMGDLCILASSSPEDQIIIDFKSVGLDIKPHLINGSLRIFSMRKTYLNDGKFTSDYMLNNVKAFQAEARKKGYKGLRTAGEMSWLEDSPDWCSAATQYENEVNHLTDEDEDFRGLCMYRLGSDTSELIEDALITHPSFVYDGETYQNPYYGQTRDKEAALSDLKQRIGIEKTEAI